MGLPALLLTTALLTEAAIGQPGLRFIDVGQGAALLARGPAGHTVLIDSGPPGAAEAVVRALHEQKIDTLWLWVHTHFDVDHVGGAVRIRSGLDNRLGTADDLDVKLVWDRGDVAVPDGEVVARYRRVFADQRVAVGQGARWRAPGMSVTVLPRPPVAERTDENSRGLALCVRLGGVTVLAAGDLPAEALRRAADGCANVEVLWASHHGSFTGISPELLEVVDPRVVVVSAGRDNPYCHPDVRTLGLLYDKVVWILDAAGLGPDGPCEGLAPVLGPRHRIAATDIWLPVELDGM